MRATGIGSRSALCYPEFAYTTFSDGASYSELAMLYAFYQNRTTLLIAPQQSVSTNVAIEAYAYTR